MRIILFVLIIMFNSLTSNGQQNDCLRPVDMNGSQGFIDPSGRVAIEPRFKEVLAFEDCGSSFTMAKNDENEWGVIDKRGNWTVLPRYSKTGAFREGYVPVLDNGKYKFINERGETLAQGFDFAFGFSEGLARVNVNGFWGYLDRAGNFSIPLRYKNSGVLASRGNSFSPVGDFHNGLAATRINGQQIYIDKLGRKAFSLDIGLSGGDFSEGYAVIWQGEKYGLINAKGTVVIPPKYEDMLAVTEGVAGFRSQLKWGFVSTNGIEVVKPIYDDVKSFSDKRARVLIDDKFGFIDHLGKLVIAPQFNEATDFIYGVARVEVHETPYYINTSGKFLAPLTLNVDRP